MQLLKRLRARGLWLTQVGVIITFALMPLWYRLPEAPPWMPSVYLSRFLVINMMVLTIAVWLLAGMPRIAHLRTDRVRAAWLAALFGLSGWLFASGGWAFMAGRFPELAVKAALQLSIVTAFVLLTICVRVPPRWIIVALMIGLAYSAAIGGAQVALQGSVGGVLAAVGEFPLDVSARGISYLTAGGMRWLRPYALLPHPNVLAGFLAAGLLAAAPLLGLLRGWRWWAMLTLFMAVLWVFLLTFSRGGWLSFAAGAVALLPLLMRLKLLNRRLWAAVGIAFVLGGIFFITYQPYILARAGEGEENVELYSLGERALLTQAGLDAARENPLQGVGAGNFPWWASYYFHAREIPVRGNNVHQALLLAWAESGLIGMALMASAMILALESALRGLKRGGIDPWARAGLLAAFVSLTASGLFDHYTWTLPQMQALWWGVAAVAAADS